jgi:hypothetical protein
MKGSRVWQIGGFISGAVLIVFGAAAIYLGINGYQTVHDELDKEFIVGGSDMSPSEIEAAASEARLPDRIQLPTCDVVDKEIDTGDEARCFAQYMRIHALEATGGLSYARDCSQCLVHGGTDLDFRHRRRDRTAAHRRRARHPRARRVRARRAVGDGGGRLSRCCNTPERRLVHSVPHAKPALPGWPNAAAPRAARPPRGTRRRGRCKAAWSSSRIDPPAPGAAGGVPAAAAFVIDVCRPSR